MHIDVRLLPLPPDPVLLSTQSVVVIDVLRATSVIIHALSQGAIEIIPVETVEEAFQRSRTYPEGTTLLGGEKNTQRIEAFDFGNSPREYGADRVKGKRIIMTTTNGTQAFHAVSSGRMIMAGSFYNLGAVAERCLDLNLDLLIFPSGDEGNFSLEDNVCGGMLIDRMVKKQKKLTLSDAAQSAYILYQRFRDDLVEAFRLSRHGRKLIRLGLGEDLPYCAQTEITRIVPQFQNGVIKDSLSTGRP